jgi:hypothetical protein
MMSFLSYKPVTGRAGTETMEGLKAPPLNFLEPFHNASIRHSGLDPESIKDLKILDPGACPGPDPGFAGMTKWPVLCRDAKVYSRIPA